MKLEFLKSNLTAVAVAAGFALAFGCSTSRAAEQAHDSVTGRVQVAGKPVAGATVTLYAAGEDAPKRIAETKTDDQGAFSVNGQPAPEGSVLYLVAKGGTLKAGAGKGSSDALALLALLGTSPPSTITVNELTTVASAFTAARFINGESISGNSLGLRIAAGNVPNLVDPVTGGWGNVLLDALNSTRTTTLANLNTLGSLVSACFTVANDDWRARFFKASTPPSGVTPKNTLQAMAGIARAPWASPKELYALFDEAYPEPKDGARRSAPFLPYLAWSPPDLCLSLWFTGSASYSNGRFMFDAEGNLWSGCNWMAGSQSGVLKSMGGGVIKFSPNGKALSPPVIGFTGAGIVDGIGWGTAVTRDKVWLAGFKGPIAVMDFEGRPLAKEADFPFANSDLGALMGIGVAADGDVWVTAASKNQLVYFPGGDVKAGKIVQVKGLKSPFDVVIDSQKRVWVSNSQSDKVARFPADDPDKVEFFQAGISVRGLALDSEENVWVVSCCSLDFPMPKVPDGASIMEQFKIQVRAALTYPKSTGLANMIRPDGTQPEPKGFTGGGAVDVPWGVNIDGNDDVWIANFSPHSHGSVVLMAGADPQGHPAGTKTGDVIHVFTSGSIQLLTDVSIDAAGNAWVANNWTYPPAATEENPASRTSTWGGGLGFTVIYGVAGPVQPPRMGKVRKLGGSLQPTGRPVNK